ncbi:MAG: hypothetical protein ACRDBO_04645 [Lachnospiraceae bacterium]
MIYEDLLEEARNEGLIVREKPLAARDGLISGRRIAIRRDIPSVQKACALAEEIGHHKRNVGDITDQSVIANCKQEHLGRLWAYNRLVGLQGIISGYKARCQNRYELAKHLGITEEYLQEAIDCYHMKYGVLVEVGDYIIIFEPSLRVMQKVI